MTLDSHEVFLGKLEAAINEKKIILPTLPEVALKVRDTASHEETTAHQLAEIVTTDAALSTRLLQVANSPLYRARHEIENVQVAITRLGNRLIRTLITSLVMEQIYQPTSQALDNQFRKCWEQSINVASICRALASRQKHLDPEQAMLAGLIYQIGKLPILTWAETIPELANNEDKLLDYLETLHPKVGKLIMEHWNFPESISAVPSQYTDFQRNPSPVADYVDVVIVAHLQMQTGQDDSIPQDLSAIPAFSKLGLSQEIEILEIDGFAEEVEQTQSMMQ